MKFSHSLVRFFLLLGAFPIHSTIADSQTNTQLDGGDNGGASFKFERSSTTGEGKIQNLASLLGDRKLLELTPCDTTLLVISNEDIAEEFDGLVDKVLPVGMNTGAKEIFKDKKNFGVEVRKVCASCEEVLSAEPSFKTLYDNPTFEKYCGIDAYGRNIQHSALVTYPLGPDNKVRSGLLPGYIYSRPTKIAITSIPSQFGEEIDVIFGIFASVVEGLVSISPDFMGYGSSTAFRSYLVKDAYPAATLPIWLKTKSSLREKTDCKTDLGNSAFYLGYSEGGYATVALADGFKTAIGVQPNLVMPGGAPYRLDPYQFVEDTDGVVVTSPYYQSFALLIGASYSSSNSDVANFNAGQDMLKSEFRDQALEWLAEKDITGEELDSRLAGMRTGDDFLDSILNPVFLSFVRGAIDVGKRDICQPGYSEYKVGVHDKLCEAWIQNDVLDIVLQADYPVSICHSVNDELVPYEYVPDTSLNPYLSVVNKTSNHGFAYVECMMDGLLFLAYGIQDFLPEIQELEGGCPTGSPTEEFLLKKKGDILKTEKCDFIGSLPPSKQKKICTAKKYQIRSKEPTRFAPASVACPDSCSGFCVKEFPRNKFLYKTKKGKTVEKAKCCKWLQKQSETKIAKVCTSTVEFDGTTIYGSAKDICTTTCGSC